jgi:hypothetical protein
MPTRQKFIIIIVSVTLSCCLTSCSKKDEPAISDTATSETPTSKQPIDSNDPAEVQRRFEATINKAIKKAAPHLKEPHSTTYDDGSTSTYFAEYTGSFNFDIQRTDSIVTPFVGTVEWEIRWYHNGKNIAGDMTLNATYAYQNGKWILKSLTRNSSNFKTLPVDEYIQLFQ